MMRYESVLALGESGYGDDAGSRRLDIVHFDNIWLYMVTTE